MGSSSATLGVLSLLRSNASLYSRGSSPGFWGSCSSPWRRRCRADTWFLTWVRGELFLAMKEKVQGWHLIPHLGTGGAVPRHEGEGAGLTLGSSPGYWGSCSSPCRRRWRADTWFSLNRSDTEQQKHTRKNAEFRHKKKCKLLNYYY